LLFVAWLAQFSADELPILKQGRVRMTKVQQSEPHLSVVVLTYGRAETLRKLLEHLDNQELDRKEYEVVVVSDHSPDHTADVCREMAEKSSFVLRFLENDQNKGIGYSQNVGIRNAKGDIILLMADDIMQSPGSLKAHLDFHIEHPRREIAALGRVIQSPQLFHISVFLRHWNPFRMNELEANTILPAYRFGAANLSFKRSFMIEYGMFREDLGRFGAAANEDLEVGYRLKNHGLELHYLTEAWAHHFHVYTLDQAVKRWYERGLNFSGFREAAGDPELTVYFHDLRWKTFREYARVLRESNSFEGREKSLAWHLFREAVRRLVLNGVTATLIWRPLLDRAEKWPWLAERMNAQIYRAYLYYQFLRGLQEG
jgi:glycosyltransferase involved in cell wall biosynthesis